MARTGRPTKLTPEIQEKIVTLIRNGNEPKVAAACVGINRDTFFDWVAKGARSRNGRFREFSDLVYVALAQFQSSKVAVINKAAEGYDVVKIKQVVEKDENGKDKVIEQTVERTREFDWRAADSILSKRFPASWAKREHLDITTKTDEAGLPIDVSPNETPDATDREDALEYAYRKYILNPQLMPPEDAETTE